MSKTEFSVATSDEVQVTKSMKTSVVDYEDITFHMIAENPRNGILPGSISGVGIEDMKNMTAVIDDIIDQVLRSMTPRYRKEFGSVMREESINVEYEDGISRDRALRMSN